MVCIMDFPPAVECPSMHQVQGGDEQPHPLCMDRLFKHAPTRAVKA